MARSWNHHSRFAAQGIMIERFSYHLPACHSASNSPDTAHRFRRLAARAGIQSHGLSGEDTNRIAFAEVKKSSLVQVVSYPNDESVSCL